MKGLRNIRIWIRRAVILTASLLFLQMAGAQYFGRNKPDYEEFKFRVWQTPHFEIYHYLDNDPLLNEEPVAVEEPVVEEPVAVVEEPVVDAAE